MLTDSTVKLNVTNEYQYHYIEDLNGYIRKYHHMIFNVKTCNDAHVILSEQHTDERASYEIVIGGWGNTESTIRTCKQCELRTTYFGSPLSCNSFKSFWISWNNGTIRVGTGHNVGHGEFMRWTDPSPHMVNYVGISTWTGSSAEWSISTGNPFFTFRSLIFLGTQVTYCNELSSVNREIFETS
jgi:hypothetical protein